MLVSPCTRAAADRGARARCVCASLRIVCEGGGECVCGGGGDGGCLCGSKMD